MTASPDGRRILIAIVTGEAGDIVDAWRRIHDPEQAKRLPPHATLCYWAPVIEPEILERQVRHAFPEPVTVRLGEVRGFDNSEQTFFVEVLETDELDAARERLYDGTELALEKTRDWQWHVTCVRKSKGRSDIETLRAAAADLVVNRSWRIDTIGYMELRNGRYEPIAVFSIQAPPAPNQTT